MKIKWLNNVPKIKAGVTWGTPWSKGVLDRLDNITLKNKNGEEKFIQHWPTAYWPDGSIKWTVQSAVFNEESDNEYELCISNNGLKPKDEIKIEETNESISIDTIAMKCIINKFGENLIEKTIVNGKIVNSNGRLVAINEVRKDNIREYVNYNSKTTTVEVEQAGPEKVVVKVEGIHTDGIREWLPFKVRFYFFIGLDSFKVVHTFFYDGNPNEDFIKGIGLEFEMALEGNEFNKHARFALESGIYSEPSKLLLTRFYHIDNKVYEKQIAGQLVSVEEAEERLIEKANGNALWNDFKLIQDSASHYKIIKRCGENLTYVDVTHGKRANGLMYVGAENVGMAIGLKSFWERHPSSLEVTGLAKNKTKVTLWLWDPSVEAMDLRHYSNDHHMSAYEGFEEMRSTPKGIANTSDIYINCYDSMPNNEELKKVADEWQDSSLLVCAPEYYYETQTTGKWGLPDKTNSTKRFFEEQLENSFNFYKNEIEQRSWYGYWNYGDVMHTYDGVRHQWRYDLGGYAWQNTELVPNIWLWYQFLRTGNKDVFKMAEAMTRHTSEVDCYHFGEYKGLGSRHNVVHWGCSCKEARISMAGLHKFYYYLTGDERVGDLLTEVKDSDKAMNNLEPLRGFFPESNLKVHLRTGPDWSAFCSNWETEWERTENEEYKNKILIGINRLKNLPRKLLSGPAMGYDSKTSELQYMGDTPEMGYHMMISFGAPQVWIEIADLLEDEEWKDMISEYGRFYMLSDEEKRAETKDMLNDKYFAWPMFATGIAAYCANRNKDKEIAEKAWSLLIKELHRDTNELITETEVNSWRKLIEDAKVTTNCVSQWCINTIMCLELIGDMIPDDLIR